jgi:hypothetical protein
VAADDRRVAADEEISVNKVDELIDRGAARLEELAREAAGSGGVRAKFADELAEDAAFLRKLKPSLIAARARGKATTSEPPRAATPPPRPKPQPNSRPRRSGGPNPVLVIGIAFAAGLLLAHVIDWRSHAHPRD